MAQRTWLIVGSVPDENFPLLRTSLTLKDSQTLICEETHFALPIVRGTPTLLAAAILTKQTLKADTSDSDFQAMLVGDTGSGAGCRKLYAALLESLTCAKALSGLTFHYLYPDVDWQNRLLLALENLEAKPCLVADAGYMYAAKMSGYASHYDLFTPDLGELSFLADENAPHPFYTRGFLLDLRQSVSELIARAYDYDNAAKWLIVKGEIDHIVCLGQTVATVDQPNVAAMEAIGGTGDLVTGVVTGLLAAGFELSEACELAARICREAGMLANPTPATQIATILPYIPLAMDKCLSKTSG